MPIQKEDYIPAPLRIAVEQINYMSRGPEVAYYPDSEWEDDPPTTSTILAQLEQLIGESPILRARPEAAELPSIYRQLCQLNEQRVPVESTLRSATNDYFNMLVDLCEQLCLPAKHEEDAHGDRSPTPESLMAHFEVEHRERSRPLQLVNVEGPVIFRYAFLDYEPHISARQLELRPEPIRRWLVHQQRDGSLLLVIQKRRVLSAFSFRRACASLDSANSYLERLARAKGRFEVPLLPTQWVESPDDSARWWSRVEGPFSAEEFLKFVDRYILATDEHHTVHDEAVLPFLSRKALVQHGYAVPELVGATEP